jgi:predicted nucleic-acid-binding Zn-ribbon protein
MREAEGELGVSLREQGEFRKVYQPPLVFYTYPIVAQNGRFETFLCTACGYTEWFARDFRPEGFATKSSLRACPECQGHDVWGVESVGERTMPGSPHRVEPLPVLRKGFPKYGSQGHFALEICHGCGRTTWLARDLDEVEPSPWYGLRATDRACATCSQRGGFHVDKVHEQAGTLNVSITQRGYFSHAVGSFSLELCASCGVTEWFAHGLEKLRADPQAGVSLLERPAAQSGGPYR